ncbi:hypothetical protein ACA910_007849 [Epithemia clementina (nom. ined.)]
MNHRVKGPTATFPKFICLNKDQEVSTSDAEEDNNPEAEDRKEHAVEQVDKTVLLDDGPDEVHKCNLQEMEAKALQSIPDINMDADVDEDNNEAEESNSVDSENTEQLMEQIQKQARQLVAFENYMDENEVLENDDKAEDDEYILVVLKDKDKTKACIQMNNNTLPLIGVCVYEKEESDSNNRTRKTLLGKRKGVDDDMDVQEVVQTESSKKAKSSFGEVEEFKDLPKKSEQESCYQDRKEKLQQVLLCPCKHQTKMIQNCAKMH